MAELVPTSEAELAEAVRAASAEVRPLEIAGGGTRRALGRPVQADQTLSTRGLTGISLYEPGGLTMVVAAGTPMAEVEAALTAEGQMLPFEPMDHRALLGTSGEPTVGGVVACAVSGPRRIQAGACRDLMLGVRFVDGVGHVIKNGGRVMKNVTGYDLVKLMAGSFGTLGVLTEVAFKVLPAAAHASTLVLHGLDNRRAVAAMAEALAQPYDVSGAAHLPGTGETPARTCFRVDGLPQQWRHRTEGLARALRDYGSVEAVEGDAHRDLWAGIRDCTAFAGREGAVWRLSLKPSDAPGAVAAIQADRPAEAYYDWAGGLVWLLTPEDDDAGAAAIRMQTSRLGGHATLIRASAATRAAVDVFEPESPVLAHLSAGLRAKFDPNGVLNPGRMG